MKDVNRAPHIGKPNYSSRHGGIDPAFRALCADARKVEGDLAKVEGDLARALRRIIIDYEHTEPEVIPSIKRRPWIRLLLCALSAALVVAGVVWVILS